MNIAVIRRKFPEYGDLPDASVLELFTSLISDILEEPPEKTPDIVEAPGVEAAVHDLAGLITKANTLLTGMTAAIKALDKPEPPEEKLSPLLVDLSLQLMKIESAIAANTQPEITIPQPVQCKSFKIKRDELGMIETVIPVY